MDFKRLIKCIYNEARVAGDATICSSKLCYLVSAPKAIRLYSVWSLNYQLNLTLKAHFMHMDFKRC